MRIMHIISGLKSGGAEKILLNLVTKESENFHCIISLTSKGSLSKEFRASGLLLYELNFTHNLINNFIQFFRLINLYIKVKPNIIQAWMYHANLVAMFLSFLMRNENIFWGIHRACELDNKDKYKFNAQKFSIYFSRFPKKIVYVSKFAEKFHLDLGFCANNSCVISGSVDSNFFFEDKLKGQDLRKTLNIKKETFLIGMVARYAKVKNFEMFFKAIFFLGEHINYKCLIVGEDINPNNLELVSLIRKYNLSDKVILGDVAYSMCQVYNAFDVTLITSNSESFGNCIIESLACGTPLITTNVGCVDSIPKNFITITPHDNHIKLSELIESIYQGKIFHAFNSENLKRNAKDFIDKNFSSDAMINNYRRLWNA